MKATEQYFPVVLFIMLYKVVLIIHSMNEILRPHCSEENYRTVFFCTTAHLTIFSNGNFRSALEGMSICTRFKRGLRIKVRIRDYPPENVTKKRETFAI